jgi:tRNA 2-selenouridine synthase
MSQSILPITDFIDRLIDQSYTLIDARSESEYMHGHIPGALNIPLLKDDQRKIVGTIYKNHGHESAVLKGFELVGPYFHSIITEAGVKAPKKEILLYCWRGGMRSNIMSWLLTTSGFNVTKLDGGYKSFRNWVIDTCSQERDMIVLGGKTGSGKTAFLNALEKSGEQVLDLEGLANHKGSAFGALGMLPQPSNEHFENLIALKCHSFKAGMPVWIENESRSIGSNILPEKIYNLIRSSPLVQVETTDEKRMERITKEYGCFNLDVLAAITVKIQKRLGPQNMKQANELLFANDFPGWLKIILSYYDRLYNYGSTQRNPEIAEAVHISEMNEQDALQQIIITGKKILSKWKENNYEYSGKSS